MGSSPDSDSNSSKTSINPEEPSAFDASSDSLTDSSEGNANAPSEEYTDSDDDSNPGIPAGGCRLIDLEKAPTEIVQKVYEGIDAAIEDFNKRHSTTYKLVEIEKVLKAVCSGYFFTLYFVAKPTDSHDNLLTKFEAAVWFALPDYKLEHVECEVGSMELET